MIRKWQKPGTDETRYYISARFGIPFLSRSSAAVADGRWIGRGDDGSAHIYGKCTVGCGRARGEDGDWLDKAFGLTTWEAWEQTFAACQTKSGNFSVAKFVKS